MTRYRVAFDGKWHGKFDDQEDAVEWARAVGKTGRIAYVIQWRWRGAKLVAFFPKSRADEAMAMWRVSGGVGGGGGGGSRRSARLAGVAGFTGKWVAAVNYRHISRHIRDKLFAENQKTPP